MSAIGDKADRSRDTRRRFGAAELLQLVHASLDDDKAEAIVDIDLAGKTNIADYMVVACGRSVRHVGAIAEHLLRRLKTVGLGRGKAEGMPKCDWVLIDAGDVIVHLFRPEIRTYYNLEKMWGVELPDLASPEMAPESPAESGSRSATV